MAKQLTDAARARGATNARSWLATRPVEVELSAIRLALELAGETDAPCTSSTSARPKAWRW